MKKAAILMGSTSDLPVIQKVKDQLDSLGIENDMFVLSAHRTPAETAEFSRTARENGYAVIIAAAGMAAHLAGAVAAWTTLPVIALPLSSKNLEGMDALLSSVQMPPGIPVGVVGIDAAVNAALLAAEILSIDNKELADKLEEIRNQNAKKILENN